MLAKITKEKAEEIRKAYKLGVKQKDIALELGLSKFHVGDIVRNKYWKVPQEKKEDILAFEDTVPLNKRMREILEQTWKEIPKHPGFLVSVDGIVWDLKKQQEKPFASPTRQGYKRVRFHKNGKTIYRMVHHLVLETFVGTRSKNKVTNHINGVKTDNQLYNLEWVSESENRKHAFRIGLCEKTREASRRNALKYLGKNKGEEVHNSKLTREDTIKIKELCKSGIPQREIAKQFKVTQACISLINTGKNWNWVEGGNN